MDVYLLNGTNTVLPVNGTMSVTPMNGTNRTVPMNGANGRKYYVTPLSCMGIDDIPSDAIPTHLPHAEKQRVRMQMLVAPINEPISAIITGLVTIGTQVNKIVQERKAKRLAQAEAHKQFMAEVYKLGVVPQGFHTQVHRMAEIDLEGAARYVTSFIEQRKREEEKKLEELAASEAQAQALQSGMSTQQAREVANVTKNAAKQMMQANVVPNPIVLADRTVIAANQGQIKVGTLGSWWSRQTNLTKGAIIGGSGAAIIGGIYLLTRKRKRRRK